MKIYIVMGTTGEYSDRTQWPVCAYCDRTTADRHADDAMLRAKLYKDAVREGAQERYDYDDEKMREDFCLYMGRLDPGGEAMRYTGTDYYVLEAELHVKGSDE